MTTVSFKVFFGNQDPSQQEIRRFDLDSMSINFWKLREKIQNIFPGIKGKRFTINWKDADGDSIIISSDEELNIALQETASEPVRKLYVVVKSINNNNNTVQMESDITKGMESLHVGVTCDGCEHPVHGFRFKCIQCPNYDLCSYCQSEGLHDEHCMLRLISPVQWKPHYGKRLARHMNKFVKKSSCNKEHEPKCDHYKKNKKHGRQRQCPVVESGASWLDTISSYFNDFANLPTESPMEGNSSEKQKNEETKEESKDNQPKASKNKKSDTHVVIIKSMGRNLSQFVDPLGIDVNSQVKSDGVDSTPNDNSSSIKNDKNDEEGACSATAPTFDSSEDKKQEKTSTQIGTSSSSHGGSPVPEKYVENGDWTLISDGVSVMLPSSGAIPKKSATPTPEMMPNSEQSENIYKELPKSNKTIHHPDKKVHKAVEIMMEMGFTNEGGWLTNLLECKAGDIVSVLDTLQHRHSHPNSL